MIQSISRRYSCNIYSLNIKYSIVYPDEHRLFNMKVFDKPEKIPETFKMLSKCRNIYTFKFKWPYCKNNHKQDYA